MREAESTETTINNAREGYRGPPARASSLWFVVSDLSGLGPMYQTSLAAFKAMFVHCITAAPGSGAGIVTDAGRLQAGRRQSGGAGEEAGRRGTGGVEGDEGGRLQSARKAKGGAAGVGARGVGGGLEARLKGLRDYLTSYIYSTVSGLGWHTFKEGVRFLGFCMLESAWWKRMGRVKEDRMTTLRDAISGVDTNWGVCL